MTFQAKLFEENNEVSPLEAFHEPNIWIRRLVVVDRLAAKATVWRRVHFRCGINIITTDARRPDDIKPIGHSVGKSLLVRLIRYCLGDTQYCTEHLRKKISLKRENAYVLAAFRIAGIDWVVARPLGLEFGSRYAWCVQSRRLGDLLFIDKRRPYGDFLSAVNVATSKCYADIDLPQAGRRAEWKDLLGWLCRDQDCHFSHHAEWRYREAESGPRVLSKEDAYLVMRMAMGLLGPDETGLIAEHRKVLRQSTDAQNEVNNLEPQILFAESQWRRQIPDSGALPLAGPLPDTLEDIAKNKQESLQRFLDGEITRGQASIKALQKDTNDLAKQSGVLEQELKQLQADRTTQQKFLDGLEKDAADQAMESLGAGGFNCDYFPTQTAAFAAGCPGKTTLQLPLASPERTVCIDACRARISLIDSKIQDCMRRVGEHDALVTKAQSKLTKAQEGLQQLNKRVQVKIGIWKDRRAQARRLKEARTALVRKRNQLPTLLTRVRESQERLAASRDLLGKNLNELSHYYTILLRWTITAGAEGKVTVDGNGLHPEPGAAVANSGTTLREYADVLSFDLACLTAAVCGFGNIPRFWVHDSPRQADSEEQLYHSVLRFLYDLEGRFPRGRKPSFQYILTTTSPPPPEINGYPFVRLRLHARNEEGKLLKCEFGN